MVAVSNMSTIDTALMPDYTAQMESFKRSDEARESMMKDILERYELLMNAHTILNQDYAMERDSRRRHQGRVEQLESELRGVVSASKPSLAPTPQLTRRRITTLSY